MIYLTQSQKKFFNILLRQKGKICTKEFILQKMYGKKTKKGDKIPEPKIIDVLICAIRKKLPPNSIKTIWGRGYKLVEDFNEQDFQFI
jgi:DNA-binding response OmpR family regulator